MIDYNSLSNKNLFALIADKDWKVAEFLYDKYSRAIYKIIYDIIKLRKEADEILFKTFVSFFKSAEAYYAAPNQNIFTCLYDIALNYIRKRKLLHTIRLAISSYMPTFLINVSRQKVFYNFEDPVIKTIIRRF